MAAKKLTASDIFGGAGSSTPYVFIFTQEQRLLLLALMERASWSTTFDRGLSDEEQSAVDALVYSLSEYENMNQIVEALGLIVDAIAAIKTQQQAAICCGTGSGDVYEEPETVYEGDPVGGAPGGWSQCYAARAYWVGIQRVADKLSLLAGSPLWGVTALVSAIAAGLVFVAGGQVFTVALLGSVATAAGIWAALGEILDDTAAVVFSGISEGIESRINCLASVTSAYWDYYDGDVDAVIAAIRAYLEETDFPYWQVAKWLPANKPLVMCMNGFSDGSQDLFPQSEGVCTCVPTSFTWGFDADSEDFYFEQLLFPPPTSPTLTGTWQSTGGRTSAGCLKMSHDSHPGQAEGAEFSIDGNPAWAALTASSYLSAFVKNNSCATDSGLKVYFTDDSSVASERLVNSPNTYTQIVLDLSAHAGKHIEKISLQSDKGPGGSCSGYWLWDDVQLFIS